ncbi:MAG: EF-hand domain-containing protein [Pseudomonadota bacterium]
MQHTQFSKKVFIAAALGLMAGMAQAAVDDTAMDAFKKMDADGDGFVTAREAVSGLITTEAFAAADKDKDGKLNTDEYAAAGLGKPEAKAQ